MLLLIRSYFWKSSNISSMMPERCATSHEFLRPGGKLVLSVPVPPGEIDADEFGHKREGYTLPELLKLLTAAGFRVQRTAYAQFKFSRACGSDHSLVAKYAAHSRAVFGGLDQLF